MKTHLTAAELTKSDGSDSLLESLSWGVVGVLQLLVETADCHTEARINRCKIASGGSEVTKQRQRKAKN